MAAVGGTAVGGTAAADVAEVELLQQMVRFVGWVGDGRKLTQTGRLTLADARALVNLLGTGDQIDPRIGNRVVRTRSSEELRELTGVVEWAKASRLVRVTGGRLVTVKKNAAVVGRPVELWARMFEALPRLGEALYPPGWTESLMRLHFDDALDALFRLMYARDFTAGLDELRELAWETVTSRYVIEGPPKQVERWRRMNDRDVWGLVGFLREFGAVHIAAKKDDAQKDDKVAGDVGDDDGADAAAAGAPDMTVTLTDLGRWGVRRFLGVPEAGGLVLQLRVTLAETSNPVVWRRLLVPAALRLDRLHQVLQVALGWENYHLHSFSVGAAQFPDPRDTYGIPDPDLGYRDERKAKLGDLVGKPGDRLGYTYDFGDNWEHEIVVEATLEAAPDQRYPACVAGEGACPPEDCGGVGGYDELREVLADPDHDEHQRMLDWMGLREAADFDPARFDLDRVNRALPLAV